MQHDIVTVTTGYIVDEERGVSLAQLCHTCGLSVESVVEMVDEGILVTRGTRRSQWRFSSQNIRRAQIARRLKRDLEVDFAGIALALDLLEQVDELKRRLRILETQRQHPEM